jgi:hypothetical protein
MDLSVLPVPPIQRQGRAVFDLGSGTELDRVVAKFPEFVIPPLRTAP